MQRLLDKADELNAKQGIITDYQIDSYADIVEAINVVQTEMGITGTTAREAASTIQGSVSMMKSAWANLVTGIADENANFPQLVENFVDSSITAAENIIPRVEVALAGAGQMVERVVPIIIEKVPIIIEKYLPKILLSGISIVLQIVAGLINAIPDLVKAIPNLVKALIDGFVANKESFLGIGKNIVEGIWNGISQMAAWLKEKISGFLGGIVNNVKGVLGIHSPSKVFAGIGQFMAEGLAEGWDSEYNDIKKSIGESLDFGVKKVGVASNVSGNGGTFGQNMTIVVQSVLDGKIIGETAYKYGQNRNRAFGGAY